MKTVTHPTTGQRFKLGRKPPVRRHSRVSMRDLMHRGVLPQVTVPESTNYSAAAKASLSNVYCNDQLGDCVVAGGFHVRGITSFNSGSGIIFTTDQTVQQYSAIGGYDPSQTDSQGNNPTDDGCDETTAINYWESTGFPDGVKLLHAVAVDPTNIQQVRLALYLFENLYFGVALPDAWLNPMPSASGFVWDVAGPADLDNGHCFIGCDLAENGVVIDTWGMTGTLTHDAISYYASESAGGQLFSFLTPDLVSRVSQKSPAGYDLDTLTSYLAAL